MSRDAEMQERWLDWPGWDLTGFARSEIRRELESLRGKFPPVFADDDESTYSSMMRALANMRDEVVCEIDRRLDALGENDNGPDLSGHDPSEVRPAQATPGDPARPTDPRLADAEALERAAEILGRRGYPNTQSVLLDQAADLRISVTLLPRDWADEVAEDCWQREVGWLAAHFRARFGPLVEHAEEELRGDGPSGRKAKARAALRALREGSCP